MSSDTGSKKDPPKKSTKRSSTRKTAPEKASAHKATGKKPTGKKPTQKSSAKKASSTSSAQNSTTFQKPAATDQGPLTKVAVLGGGRLATAFATFLSRGPTEIKLWEKDSTHRGEVKKAVPQIAVVETLEEAVHDVDVVFFGIPAPAIREVAALYGPYARGHHVVVHAARGVGEGFELAHQAIRRETCVRMIGAIGGPLHFRGVTEQRPLVAVLGSRYDEVHRTVRRIAEGAPVRMHKSADLIGIEVAGAISNVTALAAGMVEELDLGETARGVVMTRGLIDAARLGTVLGADVATFNGLAGVGDLIPRKVSSTERHHEVGARLAGGATLHEILTTIDGAVEGVVTAQAASARAKQLGIDLPLVEGVNRVMRHSADPREVFDSILSLDLSLGTEILAA